MTLTSALVFQFAFNPSDERWKSYQSISKWSSYGFHGTITDIQNLFFSITLTTAECLIPHQEWTQSAALPHALFYLNIWTPVGVQNIRGCLNRFKSIFNSRGWRLRWTIWTLVKNIYYFLEIDEFRLIDKCHNGYVCLDRNREYSI